MKHTTDHIDVIMDPAIESLNADQLHRRVEQPRLKQQLDYVLARSPFYRRKFKTFGRSASVLINRFTKLPFSNKQEILDDQLEHLPYGSNLCADPRNIRRIHKTSGTTARPMLIAMTAADIEATITSGARCFRAAGLGPHHTVAHCLNYCLWMGGYTDHQSLEAAGATVVPFGVGNTRTLLKMICEIGINAIHCTPSYLTVLEEMLQREFGMQPRDLGIKLGLFGGEPGIEDVELRDKVESLWGMKAMNANYGMADTLSMFGAECRMRTGLHFMGQGNVLAELINPRTLELLPIEAGVEGELVLTNINRQAQPVVRYRTGDIIRITSHNRCRCGRSSFRFLVKGRSDDMLVVRGINVFPSAVRTVLSKFLGRLNTQFQIVLETPPPLQTILVRAEYRGRMNSTTHADLRRQVLQHFRSHMDISPKIELIPEGTLFRTEGKTNLIVKSCIN